MISWPLEPLVSRYINSFNKLEPLQLEWLSCWKNAFRMAEVRGFCVELIDLGVTLVKPSTFPGWRHPWLCGVLQAQVFLGCICGLRRAAWPNVFCYKLNIYVYVVIATVAVPRFCLQLCDAFFFVPVQLFTLKFFCSSRVPMFPARLWYQEIMADFFKTCHGSCHASFAAQERFSRSCHRCQGASFP